MHFLGGAVVGLFCGLSDGFGASANFHVNVKMPNFAFASKGSFVSLPVSFTVLLSNAKENCNYRLQLVA